MHDPIETIDFLPDQVRAGIEGGYRWLLIMFDTEQDEEFTTYAKDGAELAQRRAEATDEQFIANEIELTGALEDILAKARAGA